MLMRILALALLLAMTACAGNNRLLVREANLPDTGLQRQQALARAADWEVRRAVAGNRHTAAEVLTELSRDRDPRVRIAVVTNLSTPEATRRRLAKDPEPQVRSVVARFEYVSAETLAILSRDSNVDIRLAVAGNWNTAEATLERLSMDTYDAVAQRAKRELEKRLSTSSQPD
jgi:hypothetical protein